MNLNRHRSAPSWVLIGMLIMLVVSGTGTYLAAKDKKKPQPTSTSTPQMDESKRAVHALNRLTFGPRPGDLEKVTSIGVDKWIEWQLNPDKIDDSAMQARLEPFRTLKMETRAMLQEFPPPPVLKAMSEGKLPLPSDPKKRALYEAQIETYKQRQAIREQADKAGTQNGGPDPAMAENPMQGDGVDTAERRAQRRQVRADAQSLTLKTPQERVAAIMKMSPDERRMMVQGLPPEDRERLVEGMSYEQRETLQALANPQGVITNELTQSKLLRAVYSERQLEEVMADFWFNHFNIFIGKGADRYLITAYERDTIRKHAMGKFEDLLTATAEDPAMLFYLDNLQSVGPNSMAGKLSGRGQGRFGQNARLRNQNNQRPQQRPEANDQNRMANGEDAPPPPPTKRGLNENYARELMELHTLGVDGGYTQKDVTEVAKVFTGWTVRQPRSGGDFEFNSRLHEPGTKHVLGQDIRENGQNEGKQVLHMLATHPATAKFISRKLAMRFVADDPPAALVDRMAKTFAESNGDIRQVLRAMFKSREFWAPQAYRAKVKTPLEFVVSAVRVTGTDVKNVQPLAQTLQKLGMPLYGMQPPTGYSMKADAWVNSAALLNRMNFGLALASGRMRGLVVSEEQALGKTPLPSDPDGVFAVMANALLAGDVSKQTQETIRKQMADPKFLNMQSEEPQMNDDGRSRRPGGLRVDLPMGPQAPATKLGLTAGMLLGSPEFQRR